MPITKTVDHLDSKLFNLCLFLVRSQVKATQHPFTSLSQKSHQMIVDLPQPTSSVSSSDKHRLCVFERRSSDTSHNSCLCLTIVAVFRQDSSLCQPLPTLPFPLGRVSNGNFFPQMGHSVLGMSTLGLLLSLSLPSDFGLPFWKASSPCVQLC